MVSDWGTVDTVMLPDLAGREASGESDVETRPHAVKRHEALSSSSPIWVRPGKDRADQSSILRSWATWVSLKDTAKNTITTAAKPAGSHQNDCHWARVKASAPAR